MRRRLLASAMAGALALSGLAAAPATATTAGTVTASPSPPPVLDNTHLHLDSFLLGDGGVGPADPPGCDETGTSSLTMSGSGSVASGTGSAYYPGTFTMTGTATIGAHQADSSLYGFPAKNAAITSWTQSIRIVSSGRTVEVTTVLDTSTPVSFAPNKAACYGEEGDGPGGASHFGWVDAYSGTLKAVHATTRYTATITDSAGGWTTTGRGITRARETRGSIHGWGDQGGFTPQVASFFGGGSTPAPPIADADSDAVPDSSDNCPAVANPGQADADGDGTGDACDPTDDRDADSDGVPDTADNCPAAANTDQQDLDGDGQGDACDADIDGDGLSNIIEIWLNCDPYLGDSDGDGVGDWVEVVISQTSPVRADTHDEPGGDAGHLVRIVQAECGCVLPDDIASGGYGSLAQYWLFGRSVTTADALSAGHSSVTDWIHGVCTCGPEPDQGTGIPGTVKHHFGSGGLLWIVKTCGCLPWEDTGTSGGGGVRVELRGGLASTEDTDGDGLIDVIEIMLGCDPTKGDTDGDGLTDREELLFGSDPTKADTDGDGMDDKREKELGCNPRLADTDGDGLPDGSDPAPRGAVADCKPMTQASAVPVGTTVSYTGAFTTHGGSSGTAHLDLPGSTTTGAITGTGELSGTHTFTAPGVYTIGCRLIDVTGGEHRTTTQTVVYDPSGGFVTGGGWIDSPAGAYRPDPAAQGPVRFGFVSQYKKGATVPTGQTEFQFRIAGMNFHAGVYDWLVVTANGTKAQYKGTGTINGAGSYGFLLTAYDNGSGQGVDRLRIKMWDKATGATVYDNRLSQAHGVDTADPQLLSQGQIVIHKTK